MILMNIYTVFYIHLRYKKQYFIVSTFSLLLISQFIVIELDQEQLKINFVFKEKRIEKNHLKNKIY